MKGKLVISFLVFILIIGGLLFVLVGQKSLGLKAKKLSDEVDLFPPEKLSLERRRLLLKMDEFVRENFPFANPEGLIPLTWKFSPLSSFFDFRIKKVLKEIKTIKVGKNEIVLWYVYNMGVIIKSEEKTVGVDLGQEWINSKITQLADHVDLLIFSHPHPDHLSIKVVKRAVGNGIPVVFPLGEVSSETFHGGGVVVGDETTTTSKMIAKLAKVKDSDLLIAMAPEETKTIEGIKITAYPAVHRGPSSLSGIPTRWFWFEVDGFRFLQTDDAGLVNKIPLSFFSDKVDVLLNSQPFPDPDEILSINPKFAFPLHHYEIGHGQKACEEDTLEKYLQLAEQVKKQNPSIKVMPLIWGEKVRLAK